MGPWRKQGKDVLIWVRDGVRERIGIFEYGYGAAVINDKTQIVRRTEINYWSYSEEREWVRLG
jgi:hypothetical protein